jgi:hypothetical protein
MNDATDLIRRLEELAAWHRAVAERAGTASVWEARLRTDEELARQAADHRFVDPQRPPGIQVGR